MRFIRAFIASISLAEKGSLSVHSPNVAWAEKLAIGSSRLLKKIGLPSTGYQDATDKAPHVICSSAGR
jgi:hypothetical protein